MLDVLLQPFRVLLFAGSVALPPIVIISAFMGVSLAWLRLRPYSTAAEAILSGLRLSLPLGIIAMVTGYLVGQSRQPAVSALVPALLTLLGGLLVYLFQRNDQDGSQRRGAATAIALPSFAFFVLVGALHGADVRTEFEVQAARRDALEVVRLEFISERARENLGMSSVGD